LKAYKIKSLLFARANDFKIVTLPSSKNKYKVLLASLKAYTNSKMSSTGRDLAELHLSANAKVGTVLGSIPASSDTWNLGAADETVVV
jgi:hypothetical protein